MEARADYGSADSHHFGDRIIAADECVAFSSQPWTDRIVAALSAPAQVDPVAVAVAAERVWRTAIWNACRSRGMSDDACYAIINASVAEAAAIRGAAE